jgi:hypothetical protein
MRTSVRLAKSLFLFNAAAVLLLGAEQPAKASPGGADLGGLQMTINDICSTLVISPCPTMPTITQAVLEIAALINNPPEIIRAQPFANVPMGGTIDAGNPSRPPALNPGSAGQQIIFPVTAANLPSLLSSLQPLAFISASHGGTAMPARLYNNDADTFVYAVASTQTGGQGYPDTLLLFYEDTNRTNQNLPSGKVVAEFSLPLVKLSNGTETPVPAILKYKVPNKQPLDCSASTLTRVPRNAAAANVTAAASPASVGINCAVVFAATATSSQPHAVFQLSVPLLLIGADLTNDPQYDSAYFYNPNPFSPKLAGLFTADVGGPVGLPPSAAPLGNPTCMIDSMGGITCATQPQYALCASLPTNGNGQSPIPAVAAFYSIATDGETWLSAPIPPPLQTNGMPVFVCPSGM